KGAPECVTGTFFCKNNPLISLEHLPKIITGDIVFKEMPPNLQLHYLHLPEQSSSSMLFFSQNGTIIPELEKHYNEKITDLLIIPFETFKQVLQKRYFNEMLEHNAEHKRKIKI